MRGTEHSLWIGVALSALVAKQCEQPCFDLFVRSAANNSNLKSSLRGGDACLYVLLALLVTITIANKD